MARYQQVLLRFGLIAPLMAIVTILLASVAYPDFNNARQYLSELGGAEAPLPVIFNVGIFLSGLAAMAAGLGLGLTLGRFGKPATGWLVVACFVAGGIGLAGAALFPWPDRRHMIVSLGLGIQIVPLLLITALWQSPHYRRLRVFLVLVLIAMAILTVFTKHLVFPGTVNATNVGWWERVFAFVLVSWVFVVAWCLDPAVRASSPSIIEAEADPGLFGAVSGHFVAQPTLPEDQAARDGHQGNKGPQGVPGTGATGRRCHHLIKSRIFKSQS